MNPYLTPEEYLEIERKAEWKSEYFAGVMTEMPVVRRRHVLIVGNVAAELCSQVRRRPCEVYLSQMRVLITPTGMYVYPDVIVVCGKPRFLDEQQDTLLNPNVIVEVLSESSEAYDRGKKFEQYRTLESLTEYLFHPTMSMPNCSPVNRDAGCGRPPAASKTRWNCLRSAAD